MKKQTVISKKKFVSCFREWWHIIRNIVIPQNEVKVRDNVTSNIFLAEASLFYRVGTQWTGIDCHRDQPPTSGRVITAPPEPGLQLAVKKFAFQFSDRRPSFLLWHLNISTTERQTYYQTRFLVTGPHKNC
jgi:hypothetical protein